MEVVVVGVGVTTGAGVRRRDGGGDADGVREQHEDLCREWDDTGVVKEEVVAVDTKAAMMEGMRGVLRVSRCYGDVGRGEDAGEEDDEGWIRVWIERMWAGSALSAPPNSTMTVLCY